MDFADYLRFLGALVFVLALIALVAWAVRRYGLAGGLGGGLAGVARGRTKRLAVVASLPLDPRRRLVLVRRDEVEHLLVLGASGETVVERNIAAERPAAPDRPEDAGT